MSQASAAALRSSEAAKEADPAPGHGLACLAALLMKRYEKYSIKYCYYYYYSFLFVFVFIYYFILFSFF